MRSICAALVAGLTTVLAQSSASRASRVSSVSAGITDIPVYNATIVGTPSDTTVETVPDASNCNYTTDDLYCFPYEDAFVQMTGWTRFFYNRNYGLINNSGLVDITMHFATDDEPAASWIGVENTGNIPINVNISWFTSTLAPQATYSAADPYYFYVRPNSAVYNAYPTGSSRGPTFYAVQTPVQKLAVVVTATSAVVGSTSTTNPSSSLQGASTATQSSSNSSAAQTTSGNGLSRGAIAGIAIGAVALFFVLVLLGIVILLLLRRQRYAEEAAAAAAANEEKRRRTEVTPGNLYTPAELAAAGAQYQTRRRPSVDQTDSSGSVPVIHQNPLVREVSTVRPARAQIQHYSSPTSRAGTAGPPIDPFNL